MKTIWWIWKWVIGLIALVFVTILMGLITLIMMVWCFVSFKPSWELHRGLVEIDKVCNQMWSEGLDILKRYPR
jgi:hypothetical protein